MADRRMSLLVLSLFLPFALPLADAIVIGSGDPCNAETSDSATIRKAFASFETKLLPPGDHRVDWNASVTWFLDEEPLWTPPVQIGVSHDFGFLLPQTVFGDAFFPSEEGQESSPLFALRQDDDNITAEVAFYATVLHLETGLARAIGPCTVVFNAP